MDKPQCEHRIVSYIGSDKCGNPAKDQDDRGEWKCGNHLRKKTGQKAWLVRDYGGDKLAFVSSDIVKETPKQVVLADYGVGDKVNPPDRVDRTPQAALERYRRQTEKQLMSAQAQVRQFEARLKMIGEAVLPEE